MAGISPILRNASGQDVSRPILSTDQAIASGAILSGHIADVAIVSGSIASGQIAGSHLSSGAIQSGHIGSGAVQGAAGPTKNIASGSVAHPDFGSGAVQSGDIASGQVGQSHISSGAITSGKIGNAAVVSGSYASGSIASGHLASGLIVALGGLTSGAVQSGHISSGAVQGAAGSTRNIASGTLFDPDFSSGARVDGSVATWDWYAASEIISGSQASNPGVLAVAYDTAGQSGGVVLAMATQSGRMPAVGVINKDVLSGQAVKVYHAGIVPTSFTIAGGIYFVTASGDISTSDSTHTPTLSGAFIQQIGECLPSSGGNGSRNFLLQIEPTASGTINARRMASGAIASGSIANGAVQSGNIGSGQVAGPHLASGAVQSGQVANAAIVSGSIASGQIGPMQIASGAIQSGSIGSGAVLGSLAAGAVIIASGTVGPNDLGSGAIRSGAIASGQVGVNHMASGAIGSGTVASGAVVGAVGAGRSIASGTVAHNDFGSGAVQSGDVASGQIGTNHLASGVLTLSGATINAARFIIDDFSLAGAPLLAAENISGIRAVNITQSGTLQIAMPSVSGRMPAVGVTISGVLSGLACTFWTQGYFQASSGMVDFSGRIGAQVWITRSGQLAPWSGSYLSGGLLSGDIQQQAALAVNSGGFRLNLRPTDKNDAQGGPGTFWISSGDIASGQIGNAHLSSGAVQSGNLASGAVGQNHLASGAVTSGVIASGQIADLHFASGAKIRNATWLQEMMVASENMSGTFPLAVASDRTGGSGWVVLADPALSGRMPAIGVINAPIASGVIGPVILGGIVIGAALTGKGAIYVTNSGKLIDNAPGSGYIQMAGTTVLMSGNVRGVMLNMTPVGPAGGSVGVFDPDINAFRLASGAVLSGHIASGQVGNAHMAANSIRSGAVASGSVQGSITQGSFNIASGTVGPNDLGSGAVLSGAIASGQVGVNHLASGSVTSGAIASGQVGRFHLASGAVVSGDIGNAAVTSGSIASGSVFTLHLAGTTVAPFTEIVRNDQFTAGETWNAISGEFAVAFSTSGVVVAAKAALSGRMPAIGVVIDSVASGSTIRVYLNGPVTTTNFNFSGQIGLPLFVGNSGELTSVPPSLSGSLRQVVGIANSQSGLHVSTTPPASGWIGVGQLASGVITSGIIAAGGTPDGTKVLRDDFTWASVVGVLASGNIGSGYIASGSVDGFFGPSRRIQSGSVGVFDFGSGAVIAGTVGSGAVQSGNIASGAIGPKHMASGSIQSGSIGSGAVIGSLGAGAFTVASGTVGPNDLGSGAILSGAIASGQVGQNHFASGFYSYSLSEWYLTAETISGLKAVSIASGDGNTIVRSERASGFRLPAIGVTMSGAVSGSACLVVILGPLTGGAASGAHASGFHGRPLYVGSGGHIVNQSGFMGGSSSGAPTLSGNMVQRIGIAISGGIFVNCDVTVTSGLFAVLATNM